MRRKRKPVIDLSKSFKEMNNEYSSEFYDSYRESDDEYSMLDEDDF